MAKKKKKSIFSRIGGAIKGAAKAVGGAIKGAASNLTGSVINATGRSTLPTYTKIAPPAKNAPPRDIGTGKVLTPNQIVSSATKSGDAKALSIALARYGSGFQTGATQPTALSPGQFGGPTAPPTRTSSGGGTRLPRADAPTSADGITQTSLVNLDGGRTSSFSSSFSGGSSGTGIMGTGTAGAGGALAGAASLNTQEIKTAKEQAAEQAKLQADAAQAEGNNFLSKIFKEQDKQADVLQDRREDLEKQYQIQAKTDEINSLQKSLSDAEVQVANQVAMANDKLGSMNFINNQVQQIERNSAPLLNRLRADINFKTGILTQNEALIEKAMEQATQESRDRVDNLKWFYTEHYDKTISKLDKKYDDAMKASIKEAEDEHDYQQKLWEWKRDTIINNGLEGLTPNDSENVIARAAAKVQSAANNLSIRNTNSLINERTNKGSETGLTVSQQKTFEAYKSQIDTYKSKEEAVEELGKVKFSVIKAIGQAGYDLLLEEITNSALPDESLSWWEKLFK